ncbi:hypothetical protein F4813DRAFT_79226 [Daldinia decipiens]|uniref:uncharacterized protein n=1 Tax=Daldinia decipiens TaxID=326647 RepID=UPI0020C303AF|nr:uncharacterized protein F4813DRAFT_79226 [Daldinia decipiens]KAI1657496.1 hypothetical protein F4813DRAFT_79226 [Daldinia decipiens]
MDNPRKFTKETGDKQKRWEKRITVYQRTAAREKLVEVKTVANPCSGFHHPSWRVFPKNFSPRSNFDYEKRDRLRQLGPNVTECLLRYSTWKSVVAGLGSSGANGHKRKEEIPFLGVFRLTKWPDRSESHATGSNSPRFKKACFACIASYWQFTAISSKHKHGYRGFEAALVGSMCKWASHEAAWVGCAGVGRKQGQKRMNKKGSASGVFVKSIRQIKWVRLKLKHRVPTNSRSAPTYFRHEAGSNLDQDGRPS